MDLSFCSNCDNLMSLYSDEENKELYLACKACVERKSYIENKCIYSNESNLDISEIINQNPNLIHDITLPSIKDNPNIICPNKECISHTPGKVSDLMYVKYDSDEMNYLYVCKSCNQKWKNK